MYVLEKVSIISMNNAIRAKTSDISVLMSFCDKVIPAITVRVLNTNRILVEAADHSYACSVSRA